MTDQPSRGVAPTRMRDQMPRVAEFLDALRQVFGAAAVSAAIRNGLQGGTDFHARENGYEIGFLPPRPAARFPAGHLIDLAPSNRSAANDREKNRPMSLTLSHTAHQHPCAGCVHLSLPPIGPVGGHSVARCALLGRAQTRCAHYRRIGASSSDANLPDRRP